MSKINPSPKAMRKLLIKKGFGRQVDTFEKTQAQLTDAISKGLVTEHEIRFGYAPKEYLDLFSKQQKLGVILQNHLNGAVGEIEAFSENIESEFSSLEADEDQSQSVSKEPNFLSLQNEYLRNPTRENAKNMVKHNLFGANGTFDQRLKESENMNYQRNEEMLKKIHKKAEEEVYQDYKRSKERAKEMTVQEMKNKQMEELIMSDKRLAPTGSAPVSEHMQETNRKINERMKQEQNSSKFDKEY